MRNQELIGVNEMNKNANGGTEIVTRQLFDLLDPSELDGVQIIASRVRELDPDKLRIYHLHDLPNDPEASHLREQASRDRFDRIVFVSNWQYQQFRNELQLPFSDQCRVIENGVEPIAWTEKPDPRTNPIRLIYTPTPHRGLELLVPVFEELYEMFPFIELDVYSSFKLYGWDAQDKMYEPLYARCKAHPAIRYHGTVDQDTVRKAYQDAHIFAYPSIWPETSCRCLIEAMMAGCLCVHPNFAALPDTSSGMTDWYDGDANKDRHALRFAEAMAQIINILRNTDVWESNGLTNRRKLAHTIATTRFGWPTVIRKWKNLIAELKA
jgi:glycosyltransferase involved in cell wall biosynthesis